MCLHDPSLPLSSSGALISTHFCILLTNKISCSSLWGRSLLAYMTKIQMYGSNTLCNKSYCSFFPASFIASRGRILRDRKLCLACLVNVAKKDKYGPSGLLRISFQGFLLLAKRTGFEDWWLSLWYNWALGSCLLQSGFWRLMNMGNILYFSLRKEKGSLRIFTKVKLIAILHASS